MISLNRLHVLASALVILASTAENAQPQEVPRRWTVVADTGSAAAVRFEEMAPGWHIHPGPAALLHEPGSAAEGTFRIEYEAFTFPSDESGSGIFFGGRGLEPGSYDFFELLVDAEGRFRLGHQAPGAFHEVVPWTRHESIAVPGADGAARNEVSVDVSQERLAVVINGTEVTSLDPPDYAAFAGAVGIRSLEGANFHVSRLAVLPLEPPR